jgi:cell shape-determining protein MreC
MLTTASRRPALRSSPVLPILLGAAVLLLLTPERLSNGWRAAALSCLAPLLPNVAHASASKSILPASIVATNGTQAAQPAGQNNGELQKANAEIVRLRELLQRAAPAAMSNELDGLEAPVIVRRALWQEPLLGLGKGSAEGVRLDAGVLHNGAVAGRIVAVAAHASSMALITHHDVAVGARLADARLEGVLHGQRGNDGERLCRLLVVARKAPGKVGEQVLTSGLDGVFPPGLWIGTVVKIRKSENFEWELLVRPAVDESGLESAHVLTVRPPETPWPVKP